MSPYIQYDTPELVPTWHFIAADGHEDYTLHEDDLTELALRYLEADIPFTITREYRD